MGHLQDNAEITFHRRENGFAEILVRWHLGCESIDRNYAMSVTAMRALVLASDDVPAWEQAVRQHLPSLVREMEQHQKMYLLNTYRALFQDLYLISGP